MESIEVLMGNETSPINITCQVDISNPDRIPAIALVIPALNTMVEIKHPNRDDSPLYEEISRTEQNDFRETNNSTMRYSYQIKPKITMNGTMIRCGVGFFRETTGSCWGEQVILVHYVNLSMTPDTCTASNTINTTTTDASPTTVSYNVTSAPSDVIEQYGQIVGISLGTVIPGAIITGVLVLLVILACKLFTGKKSNQVNVTDSQNTTSEPESSTNDTDT